MKKSLQRILARLGSAAKMPGFGFLRGSVDHGFQKLPFHRSEQLAQKAFCYFNQGMADRYANFHPKMIRRAVDFGYLGWPRKILSEVKGRDILDVGCGTGLHAVGYLVVGVRSYTGIDPKIDFDSDISKNLTARNREHFGWTPKEMMAQLPRVKLISGTFEEMAPDLAFDVAVLHNVTEHLINIEDVFHGVWMRLREDGVMIFNHHNYYCWNGHHQAPKFVAEIDHNDAQQRKFLDWRHLELDEETRQSLQDKLNFISMDDLLAITLKYFEIDEWREIPIDERRGSERLTSEIMERYGSYSRRDLSIQNVYCRARRKRTIGT